MSGGPGQQPEGNIDDGMTDAERHYFQTGGDAKPELFTENQVPVPPEPQPEPPAPTVEATPPAQPTIADEDEDEPAPQPGPDGKPSPRRVNWNKFKRLQDQYEETQSKLRERDINYAKVEERLSLLQQALQPKPQEQPQEQAPPDPQTDLLGSIQWLMNQVNQGRERITSWEQQVQTGQAEHEAQTRYFTDLNSTAAKEPNFVAAYSHLFNSRLAELQHYEPSATPEQLKEIVHAEERDLYRRAFEEKRSPGEVIMALSKARGFTPQAASAAPAAAPAAPAAPAAAAQPARGTLSAPPAQPAKPAAPAAPMTAVELVEAIKNGQTAALSLSNANGSTGLQLTPQMLDGMSDEQFADLFNALQASGDQTRLRELFGS